MQDHKGVQADLQLLAITKVVQVVHLELYRVVQPRAVVRFRVVLQEAAHLQQPIQHLHAAVHRASRVAVAVVAEDHSPAVAVVAVPAEAVAADADTNVLLNQVIMTKIKKTGL